MSEALEAQEQKWFVKWFRMQHPGLVLFAIPNGGYRDCREGLNLKAQGVLRGVPDLFLAAPRGVYAGMFIEMKRSRRTKTKISPDQERMIEILQECGYRAVVAYGFEHAQELVEDYLVC